MVTRGQVVLRAAVAPVLAALFTSPAYATSWGPREDVGVAAVATRTGKVLWEAWRPGEVPAGASREEKAAAEYLLAVAGAPARPLPRVPLLPDVPAKGLDVKDPWPPGKDVPGPAASQGKSLVYYRHARGVLALDRRTRKEVWRLETKRYPYPSLVLEAGEDRALVQIGSDVPATIHTALVGGRGRHTMRNLEPHTPRQRAAAAMLLHHYGDGYLRPEVRKVAELLRAEKDDPAAATAAKAVEKLLADWPPRRDRRRLLDGCVAALLGSDEGDPLRDFAWPGAHRVLAWCLLQELIYGSPHDGYSRQGYNYAYDGWKEQPVSLADATGAKLADQCRKVVAGGPDAERPFAASVLVSTAVGWARLTDAERKELFLSSDPSAWRWAALALAKNGRRKELIEWARERPAGDHLDVVWVLMHDMPKGWPEAEREFWLTCARRDPGGIAYVLHLCDGPIPAAFRGPIRAYLEREIAKPTVKEGGRQPAGRLTAAIYVLDGWKNPDDTPLLLEYLKHPVSNTATRTDGTRRTVIRRYGLRDHVRALLENRGVKVPPGIVYEEEVGPRNE